MSLIKSDDIWMLWTIIIAITSLSIVLEQKTKFGGKLTGPIIALIISLIVANLKIIPTQSPVYDSVSEYLIPVSVALLLFKSDARKIFKQTGQALGAFHIGALGTCIGAIIAYLVFKGINKDIVQMAPVMVGSYSGGGVNFFAMIDTFKPDSSVVGATLVADNIIMAVFFMLSMYLPGTKFFRKHYNHPHELELENSVKLEEGKNLQADYWKAKEISLIDIALAIAAAFIISAVSVKIAGFISVHTTGIIQVFFGNTFVILTTLSLICATAFPNFLGNIRGTDEIGTYLIYIFFTVIAIPADIVQLVTKAPLLFVFIGIIASCNLGSLLIFGKLFKLNIEELCLACNATLGGPTSAAAMAIAKGWKKLIVPGLLVGLWGYIIGNYLGIIIGNLLGL